MSDSSFRTVTIVGATGSVGYPITEAFLNDGSYIVKILRRKPDENEKAKILVSKGAEIVYANYDQKDDLVKALKGTDVIVSTIFDRVNFTSLYDLQAPLLAAAKEASVKRFIPSEFASGYKTVDHVMYEDKIKFREELERSGLEYTYIHTGLFQEFLGSFGFNVKNKKAKFYGDGNTRIPTTSLPDVGKYTVETLKIPEARNAHIRVTGSNLTLNEYLQKFEKASGSKWEVTEDRDVRYRFKNKIEPIPSFMDDYIAYETENSNFLDNDNDKFSFIPEPVTKVIETLVSQA
ncbi:hypothetical protein RclHR1_13400004 [Rhizophagus clarus]|uniref:Aromatic alcohol reductase n=1 Tax=Rhizophagus clarus TaxID=94130 RepID=A0A2Z6Q9Y9_9GLOM|nr:hypothetical protein RclHR1_13400004 [Rhizophagus clarus]GES90229.1 aromatic alcohol reductase [Rhizophagus clarus]